MKTFTFHRAVFMTLVALLLSGGFSPRRAQAQTKEGSPGTYRVVSRDTLSGIATHACGKTSLWRTIAIENGITAAPYRIYSDRTLKVSCAAPKKRATSIATAPIAQLRMSETAVVSPSTEAVPGLTAQAAADWQATEGAISLPVVMPTTVVNPPPALHAAAKPVKITGYELVMPKSVAARTGIPLGAPLETHYFLYGSDESERANKPTQYVRLKKASWARQEGDNIAIYVPLKELPEHFTLFIGGINEPIDGKMFAANAQPVHSKLPGPHHGAKILFSALSLGGTGYSLAAALGPIAGPSIVAGVVATRALMHHLANVKVENAEKAYNAVLAKQGTKPSKEVGQ